MQMRVLLEDFVEFERQLREKEVEVWQPHWSYQDPYVERLRRAGYPPEVTGLFTVP